MQVLVCSFDRSTRNAFGADRHPKMVLLRFLCSFLMLQAGDLETNPGPRPLKYPCQICNLACKWGQCAVRCDSCNLWYHKECMLMGTGVYDYLNKTEASWICCHCGLPNFNSSLFSSHDFTHSNPFSPLEKSTESGSDFSGVEGHPLATSSPKDTNRSNASRLRSQRSRSTLKSSSSPSCKAHNTTNNKSFKVIVVNCQSVKNKTKELENLITSTNPDVILGTESWLNPTILDGEIFPDS